MSLSIDILPARPESLAEADRRDVPVSVYEQQIASSDAWEIRVGGELAAIGGFEPDAASGMREVWMCGGNALRSHLRASLDAIGGFMDAQRDKSGPIFARVDAASAKSQRFCRLVGFDPDPAFEADGHQYLIYSGEPA